MTRRRALCSGLVASRPDAAQPDTAPTADAHPADAHPDAEQANAARPAEAQASANPPRRCPIRAHCLWYTLPPRGPGDKPLPGPYDPAERACAEFEPG